MLLGCLLGQLWISLTRLSLPLVRLSSLFSYPQLIPYCRSRYPPIAPCGIIGVWAVPFSLAATGGINFCFLFLCLLRCFSSARTLFMNYLLSMEFRQSRMVTLFGYLGIKAYQQLPQAYRRLLRPSSVLSTKASTVCINVEYFLL